MEKTKFEKKSWYPNMRDKETLIWERFLAKFPDAYDEVVYNLKLGEGADIPEGTAENIARDFKELTQHKIDVVGFKGNNIDIIELKPYAGVGAIGQVIGYRDLYITYIDRNANPNLVVISDVLRNDTKTIADKQNIKLIII
jgi:hypothetical protein